MALNFDITGAPPSPADIAAEREQVENARAKLRKKNIRFLIFAVVLVISILSFQLLVVVPSVRDAGSSPGIVGTIALYTPYVIFFIFVVTNTAHHKMIENPKKKLNSTIAELTEVGPDEISEALGAAHHQEIVSYQEKVFAQGRSLVQAEIVAIKRWLRTQKTTG